MISLQSGQFSPLNMPRQQIDHSAADPAGGYRLSPHAASQALTKGWSHDEVLEAANNPSVTYDNGRYPGQKRHIRGDLVAVVHPHSMTVKTVYTNVKETELRPDQTDKDAQKYGRSRA